MEHARAAMLEYKRKHANFNRQFHAVQFNLNQVDQTVFINQKYKTSQVYKVNIYSVTRQHVHMRN